MNIGRSVMRLLGFGSKSQDISQRVREVTEAHGKQADHAMKAGIRNVIISDDAHEALVDLLVEMESRGGRDRKLSS